MRLMEAIRLRVRDINFDYRQITVRSGKGGKDRVTVLPDIFDKPAQDTSFTSAHAPQV